MPLNKDNRIDYFRNDDIKCPKCDKDIDIGEYDLYECYSEDETRILCPFCDEDICVYGHAHWTFSTDEQEDDEEEA